MVVQAKYNDHTYDTEEEIRQRKILEEEAAQLHQKVSELTLANDELKKV